MGALRKFLAIALLALFSLPLASSLLALAPKSESSLPACCRRGAKHQCAMTAAERSQSLGTKSGWNAPLEKCPYAPEAVVGAHAPSVAGVPASQVIFAGLVSHPAVFAQVQSKLRIARDRARGKRGPPSLSL